MRLDVLELHEDTLKFENRRDSYSRRIGCPFLLHANRLQEGFWYPKAIHAFHNHPPLDPSTIPNRRRFSNEEARRVEDMLITNAPPKFIAAAFGAENKVTRPKDISNFKSRQQLKLLDGKTPIRAILDELQTDPLCWEDNIKSLSEQVGWYATCTRLV